MNNRHTFHLEIHSLEDFLALCAVIRGEQVDLDTLQEMAARLSKSTDALSSEIADAADTP